MKLLLRASALLLLLLASCINMPTEYVIYVCQANDTILVPGDTTGIRCQPLK